MAEILWDKKEGTFDIVDSNYLTPEPHPYSIGINLEIEVYSEESGMCFQEHYIIKNGCVNTKECVDYYEYYIGDYKTKKEAEADCGTKFSKEEWKARNEEEYVRRGGFSSWDCNI